jgi:hypothetical protein
MLTGALACHPGSTLTRPEPTAPFEQRVVVAVAAKQLPVPPGCVRDLRLPGEIGLLVVIADPATMAGSAVLSVCP